MPLSCRHQKYRHWLRRRPTSPALEALESRCLLSATYYVSPTGNDNNPGTLAQPFATIQSHVGQLQAGDVMNVEPGTYAGFLVGWDDPGTTYGIINGTADAPITIQAAPGSPAGSVIINSRNNKTADGINIENSNYVTIQGFTVNNATGTITRAGIRAVVNEGVVIRNNTTDHNGTWGIFTGFSQDVVIEDNITSNSQSQHGIYVSNSADNPVIRGNVSFGNHDCGIQINADASQGGDGIITGARIENNICYDNGLGGGSAINLDGVQNSRIQNNVLYNNHASGISLFMIDGAQGSKNNVVVNNSILMPASSRWAVNINSGSTGNRVYNNILLNDGTRGRITVDASSLSGLVSDYNAVKDLMTPDDGDTFMSLAQWRTSTGQDQHSIIVSSAQVFVNAASGDFHLPAGSPAIDAGTSFTAAPAPAADAEGSARPGGAAWDIGAYEFHSSNSSDTTAPTASATLSNVTSSGISYTFTVTYADDVALNAATLDSSDVLVTGPNGFSQLATFVSVNPSSNGTPRTATYRITAPGGTWDIGDNGTYTVTMQASQVADTSGNFVAAGTLGTFSVTVPSSGTRLAFSVQPKSALAGAILSPAITVSVLDSKGHLVTNDNSFVTIAIASGPAGASLSGTLTLQVHNGIATFSDLSLTKAGKYTLRAIDGSLKSPLSNSFTIKPDVATAQLTLLQPPNDATVGRASQSPLTVAVTDVYGNIITSNHSQVTLGIVGGNSTAPAFTGASTLTFNNGKATFSNLKFWGPGLYTLQLTDLSLPNPAPLQSTQNVVPATTTAGKPQLAASYKSTQTFTLTETFRSTAPPSIPFTGTATLVDENDSPLATATVSSSGTAKFVLSNLPVGIHLCHVSYPGDANHASADSAQFTLTIVA